jgi:hypothetical protein
LTPQENWQSGGTFNNLAPATYTVEVKDANGCSCTKVVTIDEPDPITLAGPNNPCVNVSGKTYTTNAGKVGYVWTYVGATKMAGGGVNDNYVTLKWTVPGNQQVTVRWGTCAVAKVYPVTVLPDMPEPITYSTGGLVPCMYDTKTYYTETGKTGYVWTVSAGGTIQGGANGDNVTVKWDKGCCTQWVKVIYNNTNGCNFKARTLTVCVYARPNPTFVLAPTPVITGEYNTYSTQPGMSNYQWNITGDYTIQPSGGGGSTSDNFVIVKWNTAGNVQVSVNYTNTNNRKSLMLW